MNLIAPKSASVTYKANQGLNMGLDFMAPKEINKSFGIKPGQ
jgi:hypothetical protein